MAQQKATNITWHDAIVTAEDREKLLNQKGCVIWFTGLSGSGKSTLANAVEQVLHQQHHHTYVLGWRQRSPRIEQEPRILT